MPRKYFIDAWFFIALIEPRDAHHRASLRLSQHIATTTLITSELVLGEVLAYFAEEGPRARAIAARAVRDAIRDSEVVSVDRPLFLRALDLYERRSDKQYSLVDCMSFVVMRDRGITHVLTNDHHFRQEGFTVLSDAP